MPCISLEPGDPRLHPFSQVQSRQERELFLVEGEFAVERLLSSAHPVHSIVATPKVATRLQALAPEATIYVLSAADLRELAGYRFHRGCMAAARRPTLQSRPLEPAGIVALGLSDPINLGAIIRNIRAFGARGLWLGPHCADPWSRQATRASMGHNLHIPIHRLDDPQSQIAALHRQGIASIAAALHEKSLALPSFQPPEKWTLWLGNEGQGLAPEIVTACSHAVEIPMCQGSDSVNVATASGIFLYALTQGLHHSPQIR